MPEATDIIIVPARTPTDFADFAGLARRYAASLDTDLAYQGFEAELATLPGSYAPPRGGCWLARDRANRAVGCVALKPLSEHAGGEMKRLFVDPAVRGSGIARHLVETVIREASVIGYSALYLDTLPTMTAAARLYRSRGFVPCPPYYESPIQGTAYFRLQLRP